MDGDYFPLLFSAFAVCLLWSLWGHGSVQFYWLSLLDSTHSVQLFFQREGPHSAAPQALEIALNFPSLCMCSLELQPCWMSQLLQGDITAEIRAGLCKEKSKDPLVASWETSKRSKDENVTHFLSPCWLLTTLGNPQGCAGIKSHLSKSSSCNFSGNERWRTQLLGEQTLESEQQLGSYAALMRMCQTRVGSSISSFQQASGKGGSIPKTGLAPETLSQVSQLFGCHSLLLHSICLCERDKMTSANAMIGVGWQGYKTVSFLQLFSPVSCTITWLGYYQHTDSVFGSSSFSLKTEWQDNKTDPLNVIAFWENYVFCGFA